MSGRLIGYARVSTADQDLTVQREALERAGCNAIFDEKKTGTKRDGRSGLERALDATLKGDTLVVWKLDRLARSLADTLAIVGELKAKGAALRILDQSIDTGTASGTAFLQMLGVFAEFETAIRKERQLAGIAKAKSEKRYKGGTKRFKDEEIRALRAEGLSIAAVARRLGTSPSTVCRAMREKGAA